MKKRERKNIPVVPRPDPATWPARVKAVRAKTGLSQAYFAFEYGVSCSTVEKWEQGERTPLSAANTIRLAQVERAADARRRRATKGETQ